MKYTVTFIGDQFAIQDEDDRFYSDQIRGGFSSERSDATLFVSRPHADNMVRQLREMESLDRPIREFEAKVKVRVSGNPGFSKADLVEFLKKSVAVVVDGDGPVSDSLLTVTLDWASLKRGKQWLTD